MSTKENLARMREYGERTGDPIARQMVRASEEVEKKREQQKVREQDQIDDVSHLRAKFPTRMAWEALQSKAVANQGQYQQSLQTLADRSRMPMTPQSARALTQGIITAYKQGAQYNPSSPLWQSPGVMSPEAFNVINYHAMRELGKEYETPEEAAKGFGQDFEDMEKYRQYAVRQYQQKMATEPGEKAVALSKGKLGEEVTLFEGLSSEQLADVLPDSERKLLHLNADIDRAALRDATAGLRGVTRKDTELLYSDIEEHKRQYLLKNAYELRGPAEARHLVIPITETPGGRRSFDVRTFREGAYRRYFSQIQKRNQYTDAMLAADPEKLQRFRKEARHLANVAAERAVRASKGPVWDPDPEGTVAAFKEYRGTRGRLRDVLERAVSVVTFGLDESLLLDLPDRMIAAWLATTINARKVTGKVKMAGLDVEEAITPGTFVEWFGEGPTAKSLDYIFRVAPSEAIGASFYLALNHHLDEARAKGDQSTYGPAGEGLLSSVFTSEIPAHMFGQSADELIDAITSNMDNSGELWMDAGPALFGEAGREHPYIARALMFVPIFAMYALEPTPEIVLGPGIRGFRKGGTVVAKGLRRVGVRLLSDYEQIDAGADILLAAEKQILAAGETDPDKAMDIIRGLASKDRTGAADAVNQMASTQLGMKTQTSVLTEGDLSGQVNAWKTLRANAKADADALDIQKAKKKAEGISIEEALRTDEAFVDATIKAQLSAIKVRSSVVKGAETTVENLSAAISEIYTLEKMVTDITRRVTPKSRAQLKHLKKKAATLTERLLTTKGLGKKQAKYVQKHVLDESIEIRKLIDELQQLDPKAWAGKKGTKLREALVQKLHDQLESGLKIKGASLTSKLGKARESVIRNTDKLSKTLDDFYDELVAAGRDPKVSLKEGDIASRKKAAKSVSAGIAQKIKKQQDALAKVQDDLARYKVETKLREKQMEAAEGLSSMETVKKFFKEVRAIKAAAKALVSIDGQDFLRKYDDITGLPSEAIAKDKPFLKEVRGADPEFFANLSDEKLAHVLETADGARKMWRTVGSIGQLTRYRTFRGGESAKELVGKTLNWVTNPKALYFFGQDVIRQSVKGGYLSFLTMTPRFFPITMSRKIEVLGKRYSRIASSLMSDLNLFVRFTPPKLRVQAVVRFLTSTEPFEIKTLGLGKTIESISLTTQPKPLIMSAMDYVTRTSLGKEALKEVEELADKELAEAIPLQAMLRAFVDDDAVTNKQMHAGPRIDKARIKFYGLIAKAKKEGLFPNDAVLALEFLETTIKQSLYAAGVPIIRATSGGKYIRAKDLFSRSIIAAAIEEQYVEGLVLAVGYKFTENMARAMNGWMKAGRHDTGLPRAITRGDLVVRVSDVRLINRPLNKVIGVISKQKKEVSGITTVQGKNIPVDQISTASFPIDPRTRDPKDPTSTPLKRSKVLEDAYAEVSEDGFALKVLDIVEENGVEYALVVDPNLGKQVDPQRIKLSQLTHRELEYASLDVLDGFLMWGMDLVDDVGIDRFAKAGKDVRSNYQAMVAHSKAMVEIDGEMVEITRMIPRGALVEFHRSFSDISKILTQNRSEGVYERAGGTLTEMFDKGLAAWRSHVLFGLVVPRPAYFMNQIVGDWAQMWSEIGFWDASSLTMLGTLGYIPVIGESLQKSAMQMTARAAREGKFPLPPMFGALFNPQLDRILTGLDKEIIENIGPKGTKMSARQFLGEAVADGVEENIRTLDFGDWLAKDAAEIRKQLAKGSDEVLEVNRLKEIGKDITFAMELKAREVTRRQRLLLYSHLRINKGLSRAEAKKILDNSLYDWTHSVSRLERQTIGKLSVFYTFTKNAYAQVFRSLFEGADIPTKQYLKRWAKGETRMQRIKQMSILANVLPATLAGETYAAGETLSPEEAYKRALRKQIPRYLDEYPVFDLTSLAPEAREILERDGMIAQQYARVGPKLTPLEFMLTSNRVIDVIAAFSASLIDGVDGVSPAGSLEVIAEELSDMRDPLTSELIDAAAEIVGARERFPESSYGRRVREGEVELLYSLGGSHFLRDDGTGALRFHPKETGFVGNMLWAGIARPALRETSRLKLLWGIVFPEHGDWSPAKMRAIAATEGPEKARLMALAELSGAVRTYLYRGYANKDHDVKNQKRRWEDLNAKTEKYLDTSIRGKD